jgi:hypothetical protein
MQKHPSLSLIEHFQNVSDPRVNRTKDHDLIDILIIAVCTLLCGGETFNDMRISARPRRSGSKTFCN